MTKNADDGKAAETWSDRVADALAYGGVVEHRAYLPPGELCDDPVVILAVRLTPGQYDALTGRVDEITYSIQPLRAVNPSAERYTTLARDILYMPLDDRWLTAVRERLGMDQPMELLTIMREWCASIVLGTPGDASIAHEL